MGISERSMPTVSAIINTKNEEKNIARCLESIKLSAIEILVVDNHSTDQTVAIAKKLGAKVFQRGPERSAQKNFGAKKAKGKILFFVDADMEVSRLVIRQTLNLFKENPKVKALVIPEVTVGKSFWAHVRALERSCYLGEPTIEAARIFEKKTFFKAGGFDEELIAAEDWDLHQKVQKFGKIGRVKAKIIHHEGKLSLIKHLKKKYYYAKNIKFYAQKHPEKFLAQSDWYRIWVFVKNWRKLLADPIHALGLLILKSTEYFAFLLVKLS